MQARVVAAITGALLLLAACGSEPQDPLPGQPIATRQKLFKAVLREFEPMGVMLRQGPWDAQRFFDYFAKFSDLVDAPWPHFRPDTCVPPAKVTPQTCSDPHGFTQRKTAFLDAVAGLKRAVEAERATLSSQGSAQGEEQARAALKEAYDRVYQACQDCHRDYRKR